MLQLKKLQNILIVIYAAVFFIPVIKNYSKVIVPLMTSRSLFKRFLWFITEVEYIFYDKMIENRNTNLTKRHYYSTFFINAVITVMVVF